MELNLNFLIILISVIIGVLLTSNRENQAADNQQVCLPFKALFVWHTGSKYDHEFIQQRRLIIKVILGFPQGTEISLVIVGQKKLHFKTNISDETWITEVPQNVPEKYEKHDIPYLDLYNAVYNYFDKDENPKMAEEILIIANDKSRIDENLKAVKLLRKKKTYITIYGKQTLGNVLTNLATDNHHVIGLGGSIDSINDAAKAIIILSCQDSKLVCDTDKYWNGNRCYACTYVCSLEAWKPSEYCYNVCPYYMHTPPDKDREVDHSTPPDKDRELYHSLSENLFTAARYSKANTILISLMIFIPLSIISLKAVKRIFCRNINSSPNEDLIPVPAEDDNAH